MNGKVTTAELIRCSGVFAIGAGMLYIIIQLIHPSEQISSVNTNSWMLVAWLTMGMSLFSLIGLSGIYLRQVKEAGWLGLIGFFIFSLFWILSMAFSFVEAAVLPLITTSAPQYVEGVVGVFGGTASEADLGVLPILAPIAGVMYALGGLLFGISLFRAGVVPRSAAALLAFGAVVTFAAAIIPHPLDRILAVPMGLAFIWLGYRQVIDLLRGRHS
ncbi:hypothetical protein [Paenibacillus oenotherae]|nr:hypothetical protein [Paenibacillus oenotherae]